MHQTRYHYGRRRTNYPNVSLFFSWLYLTGATLVRRLIALGVMTFVATVIGTALYVHGVYGNDRDALLLTYFVSVGTGLCYLAIRRPLLWLCWWRR